MLIELLLPMIAVADILFAILPEGTVRDEATFFGMIVILAGLIGVAVYLRARRKREEQQEEKDNDNKK